MQHHVGGLQPCGNVVVASELFLVDCPSVCLVKAVWGNKHGFLPFVSILGHSTPTPPSCYPHLLLELIRTESRFYSSIHPSSKFLPFLFIVKMPVRGRCTDSERISVAALTGQCQCFPQTHSSGIITYCLSCCCSFALFFTPAASV